MQIDSHHALNIINGSTYMSRFHVGFREMYDADRQNSETPSCSKAGQVSVRCTEVPPMMRTCVCFAAALWVAAGSLMEGQSRAEGTAAPAAAPAAATAIASSSPLPTDYVIGPDDQLQLVFWREKDLSVEVTV